MSQDRAPEAAATAAAPKVLSSEEPATVQWTSYSAYLAAIGGALSIGAALSPWVNFVGNVPRYAPSISNANDKFSGFYEASFAPGSKFSPEVYGNPAGATKVYVPPHVPTIVNPEVASKVDGFIRPLARMASSALPAGWCGTDCAAVSSLAILMKDPIGEPFPTAINTDGVIKYGGSYSGSLGNKALPGLRAPRPTPPNPAIWPTTPTEPINYACLESKFRQAVSALASKYVSGTADLNQLNPGTKGDQPPGTIDHLTPKWQSDKDLPTAIEAYGITGNVDGNNGPGLKLELIPTAVLKDYISTQDGLAKWQELLTTSSGNACFDTTIFTSTMTAQVKLERIANDALYQLDKLDVFLSDVSVDHGARDHHLLLELAQLAKYDINGDDEAAVSKHALYSLLGQPTNIISNPAPKVAGIDWTAPYLFDSSRVFAETGKGDFEYDAESVWSFLTGANQLEATNSDSRSAFPFYNGFQSNTINKAIFGTPYYPVAGTQLNQYSNFNAFSSWLKEIAMPTPALTNERIAEVYQKYNMNPFDPNGQETIEDHRSGRPFKVDHLNQFTLFEGWNICDHDGDHCMPVGQDGTLDGSLNKFNGLIKGPYFNLGASYWNYHHAFYAAAALLIIGFIAQAYSFFSSWCLVTGFFPDFASPRVSTFGAWAGLVLTFVGTIVGGATLQQYLKDVAREENVYVAELGAGQGLAIGACIVSFCGALLNTFVYSGFNVFTPWMYSTVLNGASLALTITAAVGNWMAPITPTLYIHWVLMKQVQICGATNASCQQYYLPTDERPREYAAASMLFIGFIFSVVSFVASIVNASRSVAPTKLFSLLAMVGAGCAAGFVFIGVIIAGNTVTIAFPGLEFGYAWNCGLAAATLSAIASVYTGLSNHGWTVNKWILESVLYGLACSLSIAGALGRWVEFGFTAATNYNNSKTATQFMQDNFQKSAVQANPYSPFYKLADGTLNQLYFKNPTSPGASSFVGQDWVDSLGRTFQYQPKTGKWILASGTTTIEGFPFATKVENGVQVADLPADFDPITDLTTANENLAFMMTAGNGKLDAFYNLWMNGIELSGAYFWLDLMNGCTSGTSGLPCSNNYSAQSVLNTGVGDKNNYYDKNFWRQALDPKLANGGKDYDAGAFSDDTWRGFRAAAAMLLIGFILQLACLVTAMVHAITNKATPIGSGVVRWSGLLSAFTTTIGTIVAVYSLVESGNIRHGVWTYAYHCAIAASVVSFVAVFITWYGIEYIWTFGVSSLLAALGASVSLASAVGPWYLMKDAQTYIHFTLLWGACKSTESEGLDFTQCVTDQHFIGAFRVSAAFSFLAFIFGLAAVFYSFFHSINMLPTIAKPGLAKFYSAVSFWSAAIAIIVGGITYNQYLVAEPMPHTEVLRIARASDLSYDFVHSITSILEQNPLLQAYRKEHNIRFAPPTTGKLADGETVDPFLVFRWNGVDFSGTDNKATPKIIEQDSNLNTPDHMTTLFGHRSVEDYVPRASGFYGSGFSCGIAAVVFYYWSFVTADHANKAAEAAKKAASDASVAA